MPIKYPYVRKKVEGEKKDLPTLETAEKQKSNIGFFHPRGGKETSRKKLK